MVNINKKGASHADWAISLGIFLLYILSMLMIIQPGVQPIYKEDRLLKIAKDNYMAMTEYRFYKTPVVIDTTGMAFAGPGSYMVTINGDMPFAGDENTYAITGADGVPLDRFYISFAVGKISFDANILAGRNTFYVISNSRAFGDPQAYSRASPAAATEISNNAAPLANFTSHFGTTEILAGVDEEPLMTDVNTAGGVLCGDDDAQYVALKRLWAYPAGKEFTTYYTTTASPRYTAADVVGICDQTEPYEQANVFVEEWATRLFQTSDDPAVGGRYGNTMPIRMGVKVW